MVSDQFSDRCVLLIGNFLSHTAGSRGVSEDLSEQLGRHGWHTITCSSKPNRLLRLSDMLLTSILHHSRYQVAHIDVFSGRAFLWADIISRVLRILKKPFILTLHGGNLNNFAQQYPGNVQRLLTSAKAVTTPSLFLQNSFSSIKNVVQYLPNAIEIAHYPFKLRSQPGPRLIWLRAFHSIYNPGLAVEVLALLHRELPLVSLTMIGPDKKDGSLQAVKRLAVELGVERNLHLFGAIPKPDVPARLDEGDIFLNTTRYESFGVAVMEAAAVGLPIVTTNVGELPYLWKDGQDALLVPPDDAEAMAKAVQRILTEPGLAERLSYNARQKAERYDWSVILPQWESLLTEV